MPARTDNIVAQDERYMMQEPFDSIAQIVLGACVGGFIGHRLAVGRERRRDRANRLQSFRAYVSSVSGGLGAARDDKLVEAHEQSVPGIRTESAKVQEDISGPSGDLDRAVSDYCALRREDIECRDRTQMPPPAKDRFGNYSPGGTLAWQPPPRYELGRKRVKAALDRLIDYAK